ncbi:MAG: FHA domain-containing protein [Fimbriimonadales bacterium]
MRTVFAIALLGLIFGHGLAQAQTSSAESEKPDAPREITLSFSGEGERWWWAEDAEGKPLSAPQKTRDASVSIKLPEQSDVLCVYDAPTGNLALLKAANLTEKTELTGERWSHVARLQVNVVAQGKPVASAVVELKDSKGTTHTRVLEPSAEGILIFERVPLGKVSLTARYGEDQKASQETTLKRERETRVPIIEIALSGSVATLEVAAKSQDGAGEGGASQTSRIGAMVMFVIALALAIGVILFLVRLATQKPQQLGEAMGKLGVELPQPTPTGQGTAAAPTAPPQPDLPPLESAGVDPTAAPVGTPIAAVASGPATRIVATQGPYAGQAFVLTGDLMTIGRDATHAIALVNDMGVSRTHAQIVRQADQTLIEDLGSTNGTYVNGVRISAPTPIKPGDTLQLGASLFRVE